MFDNKTILITGGTGSFGKRYDIDEIISSTSTAASSPYKVKKIIEISNLIQEMIDSSSGINYHRYIEEVTEKLDVVII